MSNTLQQASTFPFSYDSLWLKIQIRKLSTELQLEQLSFGFEYGLLKSAWEAFHVEPLLWRPLPLYSTPELITTTSALYADL